MGEGANHFQTKTCIKCCGFILPILIPEAGKRYALVLWSKFVYLELVARLRTKLEGFSSLLVRQLSNACRFT